MQIYRENILTNFLRLLLSALLAILAAVACLFVYVSLMFDPQTLRSQLNGLAVQRGYNIRIDGPILWQLSPLPALIVEDVKWASIYNITGHIEELTLHVNAWRLLGFWRTEGIIFDDLSYLKFISDISIQNGSIRGQAESGAHWQIDQIRLSANDILLNETDFPVQLDFRIGQTLEANAHLMVSVDPLIERLIISDISAEIGTARLYGSLSNIGRGQSAEGKFELSGVNIKQILALLQWQSPIIKGPLTSSAFAFTNIDGSIAFDVEMFGPQNLFAELTLDGQDFSFRATKNHTNDNLKIRMSGDRLTTVGYLNPGQSDLNLAPRALIAIFAPLINRPARTQLEFDIKTFVFANIEITNLYAKMFSNEGILQLASLNADLLDGRFDASGNLIFAGEKPEFKLKSTASGINILRMLDESRRNTGLGGVLGFDLILQSPRNKNSYANSSLSGNGRFTLKDFNYPYRNIESIFCDLSQFFTGRQTERSDMGIGTNFSDLSGVFSINSHEIVFSEALATTGNIKITADGVIDLSNQDFRIEFASRLTDAATSENGCGVASQLRDRDITFICDGNLLQTNSLACNPDMDAIGAVIKTSITEKSRSEMLGTALQNSMKLFEAVDQPLN
jgi:hypothetical protein